MILNLSNLEALALTIYGEARGEPIEGQIAVGNVIKNRAIKQNYVEICFAPKQFSCWNQQDPNYPILNEMAQKLQSGQVISDSIFSQCLWIARGLLADYLLDNTGGARNYITSRLYDQAAPNWAKNPEHPIKIGHQVFFNV